MIHWWYFYRFCRFPCITVSTVCKKITNKYNLFNSIFSTPKVTWLMVGRASMRGFSLIFDLEQLDFTRDSVCQNWSARLDETRRYHDDRSYAWLKPCTNASFGKQNRLASITDSRNLSIDTLSARHSNQQNVRASWSSFKCLFSKKKKENH